MASAPKPPPKIGQEQVRYSYILFTISCSAKESNIRPYDQAVQFFAGKTTKNDCKTVNLTCRAWHSLYCV